MMSGALEELTGTSWASTRVTIARLGSYTSASGSPGRKRCRGTALNAASTSGERT